MNKTKKNHNLSFKRRRDQLTCQK